MLHLWWTSSLVKSSIWTLFHVGSLIWTVSLETVEHIFEFLNIYIKDVLYSSTGMTMDYKGMTLLSEALKSNTTLTELDLIGKKTEDTKGIHRQITLFLSLHINRQQYWRKRSSIIEWSVEIKHNTHYTQSEEWKQKKEDTKGIHQRFILSFLFTSTGNKIGERGATSLSESLKSHTTLTELDLTGENKTRKTQKWQFTIFTIVYLHVTGNGIGYIGAESLSESLKSNTTLAKLNLMSEKKRRHTKDIHQ